MATALKTTTTRLRPPGPAGTVVDPEDTPVARTPLAPPGAASMSDTEAILVPHDAAAGDEFGWSADTDGVRIISGAPLHDDQGADSGAAYIFVRDAAGAWVEEAELLADDGEGGVWFGRWAAIDGDVAVVGAPLADAFGRDDDSGAAYNFQRRDGAWEQTQRLVADVPVGGEQFGWNVAIDGDVIVVSASNETNGGGQGVYVFRRAGDEWALEAKLAPSEEGDDYFFGQDIDVSGDTIVVGAKGRAAFVGTNAGVVFVFQRRGSGWAESAILEASDAFVQDHFGRAVAIAGDTIVVGAHKEDSAGADGGSAYVFARDPAAPGGWRQETKLIGQSTGTRDWFGYEVGTDGNTIVVGAPHVNLAEPEIYPRRSRRRLQPLRRRLGATRGVDRRRRRRRGPQRRVRLGRRRAGRRARGRRVARRHRGRSRRRPRLRLRRRGRSPPPTNRPPASPACDSSARIDSSVGVRSRSAGSSQPRKCGVRFSANARRDSIRSDFAPWSRSREASASPIGGRHGTHRAHHRQRVHAGGRRQRQQVRRHRPRLRQQRLRLVDEAVDEAQFVQPLRGEAEGERHLRRERVRQVGEEAVLIAPQQPALRLGHLEDRPAHGHPQIGVLHQPEAAAHRVAVDRRDDRLVDHPAHEGVVDAGREAGSAPVERLLHVLARAEGPPRAREDRDLQRGAVAELPPGLGQRRPQLGPQRVQPLGPVHANQHHAAVAFHFNDRHEAPYPSQRFGRSSRRFRAALVPPAGIEPARMV